VTGIFQGIILPRGDTAANLAASNIIPLSGERVRETDTGKWKTGDGTTHYNDLPYDADVVAVTVSSTDDLSNKNVLTALNAQTASYTLVLADKGKAVEVTSASATNVTVPPNSSVAYPIGTVIEVAQLGTGQVTLVAGAGVTLQTPSSLLTRAQFSSLSLRKRATDTWLVTGDMQ